MLLRYQLEDLQLQSNIKVVLGVIISHWHSSSSTVNIIKVMVSPSMGQKKRNSPLWKKQFIFTFYMKLSSVKMNGTDIILYYCINKINCTVWTNFLKIFILFIIPMYYLYLLTHKPPKYTEYYYLFLPNMFCSSRHPEYEDKTCWHK
jgi:hypothetical protein